MQNPKTLKTILIILAAFLVVGGGAIFIMKGTGTGSGEGQSMEAPKGQRSTGTAMSLKDILAMTTPTTCNVSSTNEKSDSTGTVYVSGGMMRTDFTSTAKEGPLTGKRMVAHMIIDTDLSYMWGDGEMKFGIKMPRRDVLDVAPQSGNTPSNQAAADINEKSDYTCTPWKPDATQFIPPTSITFNDISAMMKMVPVTSATAGASAGAKTSPTAVPPGMTSEQVKQMCGECENAGANKAACLARFGCK